MAFIEIRHFVAFYKLLILTLKETKFIKSQNIEVWDEIDSDKMLND